MIKNSRKEVKGLEVSAGLLVGYILAGWINVMVFDKSWGDAFNNQFLIFGVVGLFIAIYKIIRLNQR